MLLPRRAQRVAPTGNVTRLFDNVYVSTDPNSPASGALLQEDGGRGARPVHMKLLPRPNDCLRIAWPGAATLSVPKMLKPLEGLEICISYRISGGYAFAHLRPLFSTW
jgi:hypothetical protein